MEEIKETKKTQSKAESTESFLSDVNIMIKNAKLPEIEAELDKLNAGGELINTGSNLLTEVLSLQALQQRLLGKYNTSAERFKALKDKALDTYKDYYRIAKLLFENDKTRINALHLEGKRESSVQGFSKQAEQFYQNALSNPETLGQFMTYNITEEMLKNSYEEFKFLADLNAAKRSEKVEASNSTKKRDEKLIELREWVSKFKTLAKIALKDKEYLLDKLNI